MGQKDIGFERNTLIASLISLGGSILSLVASVFFAVLAYQSFVDKVNPNAEDLLLR